MHALVVMHGDGLTESECMVAVSFVELSTDEEEQLSEELDKSDSD